MRCCFLVGAGGFGPPKSLTTDLQSAPFGHLGTLPNMKFYGAGGRTRTPDLLITNQLLYQLSYTSKLSISASNNIPHCRWVVKTFFAKIGKLSAKHQIKIVRTVIMEFSVPDHTL